MLLRYWSAASMLYSSIALVEPYNQHNSGAYPDIPDKIAAHLAQLQHTTKTRHRDTRTPRHHDTTTQYPHTTGNTKRNTKRTRRTLPEFHSHVPPGYFVLELDWRRCGTSPEAAIVSNDTHQSLRGQSGASPCTHAGKTTTKQQPNKTHTQ